jgi:hypothetical protein
MARDEGCEFEGGGDEGVASVEYHDNVGGLLSMATLLTYTEGFYSLAPGICIYWEFNKDTFLKVNNIIATTF